MTAETTIPSPATEPLDDASSPLPVIPSRGGARASRFPARRPPGRPVSPLPLLAADGTAALLGALSLTGTQFRPLPPALLVAASLLLRPPRGRPSPPGVLDELPAVCGRAAVAWLALATLLAAYRPDRALSVGVLLVGFAVHAAAGCVLRGTVHARRRAALVRNPRTGGAPRRGAPRPAAGGPAGGSRPGGAPPPPCCATRAVGYGRSASWRDDTTAPAVCRC